MKMFVLIITLLLAYIQIGNAQKLSGELSGLTFEVEQDCSDPDFGCTCVTIMVKDGTRKQLITVAKETDFQYHCEEITLEELIFVQDLNFDGYADFYVMNFCPTNRNESFSYWIYNPVKKKYFLDKAYDEIISPRVSIAKERIYSYEQDGCCLTYKDAYEIRNNKLVKVEQEVFSIHFQTGEERRQHWILKNGEMVKVK